MLPQDYTKSDYRGWSSTSQKLSRNHEGNKSLNAKLPTQKRASQRHPLFSRGLVETRLTNWFSEIVLPISTIPSLKVKRNKTDFANFGFGFL